MACVNRRLAAHRRVHERGVTLALGPRMVMAGWRYRRRTAIHENIPRVDLSSARIPPAARRLRVSPNLHQLRHGNCRFIGSAAATLRTPSRNFAIQRLWRPSDIIKKVLSFQAAARHPRTPTLVDRSLPTGPAPALPNPATPIPAPTAGRPTRVPPAAGWRRSSLNPWRRHRCPARLRDGGAQRSDQGCEPRHQQCSAITHSSYLRSA